MVVCCSMEVLLDGRCRFLPLCANNNRMHFASLPILAVVVTFWKVDDSAIPLLIYHLAFFIDMVHNNSRS